MRTYSTPQSAYDGEITKLAIIECIVSVAIYVSVGLYLGTFRYLALAVVFAPLMLFRTEVSADWGLSIYSRWINFLRRLPEPWSTLALFTLIPLTGGVIRIVATVYWAIRRPLQTLRDTPQNWLRQSLCTDLAHPPELVPLEVVKGNENWPTFANFLDAFRSVRGLSRVVFLFVISPLIILGWLPSVVYRVSFKATEIVYTPFIWVAHATLRNPLSLRTRLERITKGEM